MRDRKKGIAAGVALFTIVAAALAGLPLAAQTGTGDQAPEPSRFDLRGLPSENTAFTLTVVGTATAALLPFSRGALGWAGVVPFFAGPSFGAMYAGCWGRALCFTSLRFLGTVLLAAAAFDDEASYSLAYVWLGSMALTAVVEIATIKAAVRSHNQARLRRRGLRFDAAPLAMRKGGGLQLRLSF